MSKKRSLTTHLSDNERFVLIRLVRERPILYDNKHVDFKNRQQKSRLWDEIAEELNLPSGEESLMHWTNLRNSYKRCHRELRNQSKDGTEPKRIKWTFFDAMQFLKDFGDSTTDGHYASDSLNNDLIAEDEQEENSTNDPCDLDSILITETQTMSAADAMIEATEDLVEHSDTPSMSTTCHGKRQITQGQKYVPEQKKPRQGKQAFSSKITETQSAVDKSNGKLIKALEHEEENEDLYFGLDVAAMMKKLKPDMKLLVRAKVYELMVRAQCNKLKFYD